MKILPKLKEKLDNAKTQSEKKQIFLDVGLDLTDEELNKVSGGFSETKQRQGSGVDISEISGSPDADVKIRVR